MNITFENSIVKNNYGGVRFLYRYHEYSNCLWHFEIRNNKFANNKQSLLRVLMPRIHQFSETNHWLNTTHSINMRYNEFTSNSLFELSVSGFYAQVNITKNIFAENECRAGLFRFTGTEKTYFIYKNLIESNLGRYVMDMAAHSHASYVVSTPSLFVENILQYNRRLTTGNHGNQHQQWGQYSLQNAPSSYTLAVRGLQNCTFTQNSIENPDFKYELVGAMTTRTLNSTVDALGNWWGTGNADFIFDRIFDISEWNNHARVNFVPFCVNRHCDSLSRVRPTRTAMENMNMTGQFMLGGLVERDITLRRTPVPYQVNADLTVMPGATLFIDKGKLCAKFD